MDTYSSFVFIAFVLSLLSLFLLSRLLNRLIRKQIDEQMKAMIPIMGIRKRVGIRINWRK
tara:strand:- start:140 stop:319 length:180 start_codon:yes stop_codon:yes gene_type:complete